MTLDLPTIVVAGFASICMSTLALAAHFAARPNLPGLGAIIVCFLCQAISLLFTAYRGLDQPLLSVPVSEILTLVGSASLWIGFTAFLHQPTRPVVRLAAALVAIGIVVNLAFTYVAPDLQSRLIATSMLAVVLMVGTAAALMAGLRAEREESELQGPRMGVYLMLAAVAVQGLLYAGRVANLAARDLPMDMTFAELVNPRAYLFVLFAIVLGSYAVIIITSERLQSQLIHQANTDTLTGAMNRRAFTVAAEVVVANAARTDDTFTLIQMDLDHFKTVNDTLGHAGGDTALQAFVDTVQARRRAQDIFARLGGEEFVLLLPSTGPDGARIVAETIRQAVKAVTVRHGGRSMPLSVSMGAVTQTGDGHDLDSLMSAADHALYEAKATGRDRVVARQVSGGPRLVLSAPSSTV